MDIRHPLKEAIDRILDEYEAVKLEAFAGHPFHQVLRKDLPTALSPIVDPGLRYKIKGSPGMTTWTHCPWTAILDRLVTDSPQRGYYPTFLFRADMSGFYLTLNQGITDIRKEYKAGAADVLRIRAAEHLARLGKPPSGFATGKIEVGAPKNSDPSFYDYGNIFAKFFPKGAIPTDVELAADIRTMMAAYQELAEGTDLGRSDEVEVRYANELDVDQLFEETRRMKFHFRVERNQTLIMAAKKAHGFHCQACGFDFSKVYGALGSRYIEAHHLTPLSELTGKIRLNPKTDFAVLCANCHRMIHRMERPTSVEGLKAVLAGNENGDTQKKTTD